MWGRSPDHLVHRVGPLPWFIHLEIDVYKLINLTYEAK